MLRKGKEMKKETFLETKIKMVMRLRHMTRAAAIAEIQAREARIPKAVTSAKHAEDSAPSTGKARVWPDEVEMISAEEFFAEA